MLFCTKETIPSDNSLGLSADWWWRLLVRFTNSVQDLLDGFHVPSSSREGHTPNKLACPCRARGLVNQIAFSSFQSECEDDQALRVVRLLRRRFGFGCTVRRFLTCGGFPFASLGRLLLTSRLLRFGFGVLVIVNKSSRKPREHEKK